MNEGPGGSRLLLKRFVQYRPDVRLVPDSLAGGEYSGPFDVRLGQTDGDRLGRRFDQFDL